MYLICAIKSNPIILSFSETIADVQQRSNISCLFLQDKKKRHRRSILHYTSCSTLGNKRWHNLCLLKAKFYKILYLLKITKSPRAYRVRAVCCAHESTRTK